MGIICCIFHPLGKVVTRDKKWMNKHLSYLDSHLFVDPHKVEHKVNPAVRICNA